MLVALCAEKKLPTKAVKPMIEWQFSGGIVFYSGRALVLRGFDNIEHFCQHNDRCLLGFLFVGALNRGLYKQQPKTGKSTEVCNMAGVQKNSPS
jgi:hypothetical protein